MLTMAYARTEITLTIVVGAEYGCDTRKALALLAEQMKKTG